MGTHYSDETNDLHLLSVLYFSGICPPTHPFFLTSILLPECQVSSEMESLPLLTAPYDGILVTEASHLALDSLVYVAFLRVILDLHLDPLDLSR